jgi:hypothetical protein
MSLSQTLSTIPAWTGGKNRLINGSFQINQRGGGTLTSSNYLIDRWGSLALSSGGTIATNTFTATINGVPGVPYVSCWVSVVPTTLSGSSYFGGFYHNIESCFCYDMQGQPATLSFWVSATVAGTYTASLTSYSGTYNYVTTFTVAAANTWQKVVITFPAIPVGLNIAFSNAGGLTLILGCVTTGTKMCPTGSLNTWNTTGGYFSAQGCTNWTGTVNNSFLLSQVQLEIGSVATPFEVEHYTITLTKCRRYYYATAGANLLWQGYVSNGSGQNIIYPLPTQMRATPTVNYTAAGSSGFGAVSLNGAGSEYVQFSATANTTGGGAYFQGSFNTNAEL